MAIIFAFVFNHNFNSWVVIDTPTDRPKSVRNHCVIEVFGGVFVLSRCFLDFSVGVGALFIGLSQISFFFSLYMYIFICIVKLSACIVKNIIFCIVSKIEVPRDVRNSKGP